MNTGVVMEYGKDQAQENHKWIPINYLSKLCGNNRLSRELI